MEPFPEQQQYDFSTLLLEDNRDFPIAQPIINFIPKDSPQKLTLGICAWNENSDSLNDETNKQGYCDSPQAQSHKQKIQDFLSTIRIKNESFYGSSHKNKSNRKSPSINRKNEDSLLPLNNTLITFPKSRSQFRKLQGEQKIILQKLYRKRQKSKIVPKQISINPTVSLKPTYPAKNYLSKNRSFIHENQSSRILNPQLKRMNEMLGLKRRFASSYYKKITVMLQNNWRNQTISEHQSNNNSLDKSFFTIDRFSKNPLNNSETRAYSPARLDKIIYSSPKFNNMVSKGEKDLSRQKVKQEARNSDLNRKKVQENSKILLLGSTITKWKFQAQQKLKPFNPIKE